MKKILLVDSTNNFIRNYAVKPDLSSEGESIGGLVGFLATLGYFIRIHNPDRVILIWDGPGGSKKRKAISERYKSGRKPRRLNRNYDFELDNPEQNMIAQRLRLGEYLKLLPVRQLTIPDVEADDVIAYLSQYLAEEEKIIASNDKDFFQLVGEKVKVFRTTKKVLMGEEDVVKEYGIYPKNFAIARSIVGDSSDNLKGVYGIGFPRLLKYLPFFGEDKKVSLDDMFEFCRQQNEKKYRRILDAEKVIIENYQLMQLENPIISFPSIQKAREGLEGNVSFNATSFRMKLLEDGITSIGDSFFRSFHFLQIKERQYGSQV